MKKVELLAPAGNFGCLKAAINNGANAVYLGGKNFSARAFANNFNEEKIIEAVKYSHLRNVKVYVTLNTLLNEDEFTNAIKMVKFYYDNNVDALLIQDLGLYYYIKENYPDFEIHCSTQMHVHNIEGIKTAKKLGFKRVVLARESTLDFIKEACKCDIEIETFVHGAICVSYSGQCLMSSVTKNRSANKGMCAQCCRLKYSLYENDKLIDTDTDYPLSPKDMCLINDIPDLIKAGVSSFKIEGRLKSSAYVGYVTRLYRKAIDSYYNNIEYKISDIELEHLKVLFNRNFTNDYLTDKNNLFGQKTPNHLGIEIGEAFAYKDGFTLIKLTKQLNQFDGIRINDFGCIVNMLYKNDLLVNSGQRGETVAIKTEEKQIGKVYKTLDYEFENEISNTNDIKFDLNLNIRVIPNEKVKVILSSNGIELEYVSDIIAQQAKNSPLTLESIKNQFSKLNETIYNIKSISIETDNAFLPVKILNEIRRNSIEAFDKYRLSLFKRNIINRDFNFEDANYNENSVIVMHNDIAINENDEYQINYVINRDSKYSKYSNAVICEIGGLLRKYDKKIAYYTLNCSNSYCYEFFKKIGFDNIIVSSELTKEYISKIIDKYYERNNIKIRPYYLESGNRVLMYIKSNPFDKYMNNENNYRIKDGNNIYDIKHNNGITEIIENNDKLNNLDINKQVFNIYK